MCRDLVMLYAKNPGKIWLPIRYLCQVRIWSFYHCFDSGQISQKNACGGAGGAFD